jgi:hypothetical protein
VGTIPRLPSGEVDEGALLEAKRAARGAKGPRDAAEHELHAMFQKVRRGACVGVWSFEGSWVCVFAYLRVWSFGRVFA